MDIIKKLFASKKFVAAIAFMILMILAAVASSLFGIEFTEDQIYSAAGVIAAYLIGQGAADIGKEKAVIEAENKPKDPIES